MICIVWLNTHILTYCITVQHVEIQNSTISHFTLKSQKQGHLMWTIIRFHCHAVSFGFKIKFVSTQLQTGPAFTQNVYTKLLKLPWKLFCALAIRFSLPVNFFLLVLMSTLFLMDALLNILEFLNRIFRFPSFHTRIFFYLHSFHNSLHSWEARLHTFMCSFWDFLRPPPPYSRTSSSLWALRLSPSHSGTSSCSLWDFFLDFTPPHSVTSSSSPCGLPRCLPPYGTSSDLLLFRDLYRLLLPLQSSHPCLCSSYFCHCKQMMLQSRVYCFFLMNKLLMLASILVLFTIIKLNFI